jgi:hypothetical protein
MEYEIKNLPKYILNSSGLDAYIEDFGDETDTLPISEKNKIFEVNSITNDNIGDILENIRYFGTYESDPIYYDVFCFLVNNDKSILDNFSEIKIFNQVNDFDPNNLSCNVAVKNGSLFALRYSHEHGSPWDVNTSYYAAKYNNLNCLQYLHENGCPWDESTCSGAADNDFSYEKNKKWSTYLDENPLDTQTYSDVIETRSLECLKYAREHGCPWNDTTIKRTLRSFNFKCLYYSIENNCPCDKTKTWIINSFENDPKDKKRVHEFVKFLHEHGFSWDEKTSFLLAHFGCFETLKYAHEKGCPWDEQTCEHAVRSKDLDCLKYAHENGCPWNENRIIQNVILFDKIKMLEYLKECGCIFQKWMCDYAANINSLECLEYLNKNM